MLKLEMKKLTAISIQEEPCFHSKTSPYCVYQIHGMLIVFFWGNLE